MTVSRHIEMGGAPERWRLDLGFTAGSPEQLVEFSQKIFPIARREGVGWEGGPCIPPSAITDGMVERAARAFDHGPYAQLGEAYKRQAAMAVLSAALKSEASS